MSPLRVKIGRECRLGDEDEDLTIESIVNELGPIHLRDSCQCPICVDPSTKQKNFRSSQIPRNIAFRTTEFDLKKNTARITWENDIPGTADTHVSEYTRNDLSRSTELWPDALSLQEFWNGTTYAAARGTTIDYHEFLESPAALKEALSNLCRYGLVFIKGIPFDTSTKVLSAEEQSVVSKIATKIGPLYNSHYGMTWNVRSVASAKNVAYTNTDLGFHMDLLYKENPPFIQLLHCCRNSQAGGESLFVDSFQAALNLWKKGAEGRMQFELLSRTKLPYGYQNDNQSFKNAWPVVDADINSNRYDRGHDSKVEGADSSQPLITQVFYSPPFQRGLPLRILGAEKGREKLPQLLDALSAFEEELNHPDNIYEVKMEPGTCVIFENLRQVKKPYAILIDLFSSSQQWLTDGTCVGSPTHDEHSNIRKGKMKEPGGFVELTLHETTTCRDSQHWESNDNGRLCT